MENVTYSIEGSTMTIKVDLSKPGALSSTGKTLLVASTRGAVKVDYPKREVSFSVNVMAKR